MFLQQPAAGALLSLLSVTTSYAGHIAIPPLQLTARSKFALYFNLPENEEEARTCSTERQARFEIRKVRFASAGGMFPIFPSSTVRLDVSPLSVFGASRWRGGWIDLRVAFRHPGRMDGFTWEWRCDPWGWGLGLDRWRLATGNAPRRRGS